MAEETNRETVTVKKSKKGFWNWFRRVISSAFYEEGNLSLTRVIAFGGYIVFVIGSFYLMYSGKHWEDYTTFASYTGGAGVALQFGNKFINSKYNSIMGGTDKTSPIPCPEKK